MNEKSDLVHTERSVGSFMCFSELISWQIDRELSSVVKGFGLNE